MRRTRRTWLLVPVVVGAAFLAACLGALVMPSDFVSRFYFYPSVAITDTPDAHGVPFERGTTAALDGSALETWRFPARGTPARALVVVAHGNAANLSHHWQGAAPLATRGFEVVAFDYRGFGRSPGIASRRRAVQDLESVLDAESRRAKAEGVPLLVLGQSMGAAVAVEAVADRARRGADDVKALALDSPFASWPEIAWWHVGRGRPWSPAVRLLLRLAFAGAPPDPASRIRDIRGVPLLVVAGESDLVCPLGHAEQLADAAGSDVRLFVVPQAPHVGQRTSGQESLVQDTLTDFFSLAAAR